MKQALFYFSCILVAIFASGCVFSSREITISRDDNPDQLRKYYYNELLNYDGMGLETENFLNGNLLQDDYDSNPRQVLNKLKEFYQVSENPKYLIIAADFCRHMASQADEEEAIKYHLSSYNYCTSFIRVQKNKNNRGNSTDIFAYDMFFVQVLQNYNEACSGIFDYLRKRNVLDADSITMNDIEGRKYVLDKPEFRLSVPRDAIQDFSLCAAFKVKDLRQLNRSPGLGVPLVAYVKMKQWYSSLKTPKGLTVPVTFFITREDKVTDTSTLKLIFIDSYKQEIINGAMDGTAQVEIPCALDFSTPLACFLDNLTDRNLLGQMLNPFEQEVSDGLYMVEPYQPGKIPVVFIHGLMSSPETWMQMINSLKNDPNIRRRYQFWFFSYSTGMPVLFSAQKLRNALLAAQKEFCTTSEATENFNRMVLVGHSMGGLLTRLMVQDDPHYIVENLFETSWEQIMAKLKPEDLSEVESVVPYSLPFVHRVVFMAVPHKGANMAKSPLAHFAVGLIKLPATLLSKDQNYKRIAETIHPTSALQKMRNRFFTGIDNLNPENKFTCALGSSPIKSGLVYHCVIGNRKLAGTPGGSDGVVPYWSSHLDNAASELIVKSDHSVHRRPEASQELLRILLLHLKETKNQ